MPNVWIKNWLLINWSREAMFQKMKNKLFLKALPDSSPDAVSPRPPAGSQIRSKYTHEHAQQGHSVLEIGWRFLKKLRRWQYFSIPKPGECPLEAFLYKTGFFPAGFGTAGAPGWGQKEARKEENREAISAGEGPFTPNDENSQETSITLSYSIKCERRSRWGKKETRYLLFHARTGLVLMNS